MDPAQALTGADDAANAGEPDQPASTPRPVRDRRRRVLRRPRPDLAAVMASPATSPQNPAAAGAPIPENDVYGRRSLRFHPSAGVTSVT